MKVSGSIEDTEEMSVTWVDNRPDRGKKYFLNHRECILIIVLAAVILFTLAVIPLFKIQYVDDLPTLSDAFEMSQGPEYTVFKSFVDLMIVLFIFDLIVLVGGIIKCKKVSLVASILSLLYMGQIIVESSKTTNEMVDGLISFSLGFWIVIGLNVAVVIACLVE